MQTTLALLSLAAVATASPASWSSNYVNADNVEKEFLSKSLFDEFTNKYNKVYAGSIESSARFAIFRANLDRIASLNELNGSPAYGINAFSDMSADEFAQTHFGFKPAQKNTAKAAKREAVPVMPRQLTAAANVTAIDWRTKGAVTDVKDQGQCGSCWAFSAVEQIETAYFLAGEDLPELSPQQVVSCDNVDAGCNGGDTPTAYAYVQQNGIETESVYPYTSGTTGADGTCKYKAASATFQINGYLYATDPCTDDCDNQDEATLAANIAAKGPASICVNANAFQLYTSGVITAKSCGASGYYDLNHCVQIAGFDIKASKPYWIVRNSWGTSWGEDGYIRVEYDTNACGVADETTFVTL